jgi:hypothetical protein
MASGKVIHNLHGGLGPRQRVLRGGSGDPPREVACLGVC